MVTIDSLKNSNNVIFRKYFSQNDLVKHWADKGLLYNTLWHGKLSDNSFCLKPDGTYRTVIPSILKERFGIINDCFDLKYREAISGDGQEWTRITNLNSSSLLALLFFYSVSKDNPLYINGYTFCDSFFEVKTHVFDDAESNMDVVLRGFDAKKNPVVLFLESKFSEYLGTGDYNGISKKYHQVYTDLGIFGKSVEGIVCKEDGDSIRLIQENKEPIYCGGIKQMISHYIGVSNYSIYRENALAEHDSFFADNGETILLGEVLFKFDKEISNAENKRKKYATAYQSLAKVINNDPSKSIVMFENVLTYQELLSSNQAFQLTENVKKLYKF